MQKLDKNLKKLKFNLWSNRAQEDSVGKSGPAEWSFIYGIGTEGLSDFEMAIDELGVHEAFDLEINEATMRSYFGWLYGSLISQLSSEQGGGALAIKFELKEVNTLEPKEIVTAIANMQKQGGCSSDCGCGCH